MAESERGAQLVEFDGERMVTEVVGRAAADGPDRR